MTSTNLSQLESARGTVCLCGAGLSTPSIITERTDEPCCDVNDDVDDVLSARRRFCARGLEGSIAALQGPAKDDSRGPPIFLFFFFFKGFFVKF
jgi:hypothetical protein